MPVNFAKSLPVKRRLFIAVGILSVLCVALVVTVVVVTTRKEKEEKQCLDCQLAAKLILQNGNFDSNPCENFYEYACGNWSNHPIPEYDSNIGVTKLMKDQINKNLLTLLGNNMYIKHGNELVIKDTLLYYDSCMNMSRINQHSIVSLLNLLDEVIGPMPLLNHTWNGTNWNWVGPVAKCYKKTGLSYLVRWSIDFDKYNSSRSIIKLGPPNFNVAAYVSNPRTKGLFKFFVLQILSYLINTDLNQKGTLLNEVDEIVDFEFDLIKLVTPDHIKPPKAIRVSINDLNNRIPGVDWLYHSQEITNDSFVNAGLPTITGDEVVELQDAGYLTKVIEFLKVPNNTRKAANYLTWNILYGQIHFMPQQYQRFFYNYTSSNPSVETSINRALDCLNMVRTDFPEVLAYLYLTHFFDEGYLYRVNTMTESIRNQFKTEIEKATWMDTKTKKRALKKLEFLRTELGYAKWQSDLSEITNYYQSLKNVGKIGIYAYENRLIMLEFHTQKTVVQLRKADRNEPFLTEVVNVDAVYSRNRNALGVSAGMIMPPYYYRDTPEFLNYGGLGTVIGHELTHAFDVQGMEVNENGTTEDWWSPADRVQYGIRSQCFVDQYQRYGFNGRQTLQENVADNVGIRLAYYAYQSYVKVCGSEAALPGLEEFTPEQVFFLAKASIFCSHYKDGELANDMENSKYSSPQYRVIGPLSNFKEFHDAFNCNVTARDNDTMYNENQCVLW